MDHHGLDQTDNGDSSCITCRLTVSHCACSQFTQSEPNTNTLAQGLPYWVLLQHENERSRDTATGQLAINLIARALGLPSYLVGSSYTWQRKQPPVKLIEQLALAEFQPWLLFPADNDDLKSRAFSLMEQLSKSQSESSAKQVLLPPTGNSDVTKGGGGQHKRPLIIVPDGTWKEVRKIIRKSPWLDQVPLLTLEPEQKTAYTLRRNPDQPHLCTLEVMAFILTALGENQLSDHLKQCLGGFQLNYQAFKSGHPLKR